MSSVENHNAHSSTAAATTGLPTSSHHACARSGTCPANDDNRVEPSLNAAYDTLRPLATTRHLKHPHVDRRTAQ
ncbi:hypothetical protein D3C74_482730 [compost metagenome]